MGMESDRRVWASIRKKTERERKRERERPTETSNSRFEFAKLMTIFDLVLRKFFIYNTLLDTF